MQVKIVFNSRLIKWFEDVIIDMLQSISDDNPSKISTILAVNNMLNQIDYGMSEMSIPALVGDALTNKMIDEVKDNL